jgi:putative membrane protein insertion efficiency factor
VTADRARPTAPARALALPIRAWRLVSVHLPPRCRFHPSCSQYALEALALHGAARGSWLAVRRVGRCHPWHDGGLDPVPRPTFSTRAARHLRSGTEPVRAAEES